MIGNRKSNPKEAIMLFKNITLIDENYNVQENVNVITGGNKITYIGRNIPVNYRGETYDGQNKLLMPGFFNAHCHVPMTLLRGYGEDLPLDQWLNDKMFPFEALLTEDDIYWGSQLGIAEMIKSGAVSFTDMYLKLGGIGKAVNETGIKANLSYGAMAFGDEKFTDTDAYSETLDMIDYIKDVPNNRIKAEASIHAEYTSNPRFIEEVVQFASDYKLQMHTHASESADEVSKCKGRRDGLTPIEYLEKHGVFNGQTTVAHCVWLQEGDYAILKNRGATVAHCPSSNMKLASGIAPVKKMLDYGIKVAVGTDGAASNNNLNMLEELNLASMLQKVDSLDPLALGPNQLLEIACKNGAFAQGREESGCIKVGNSADVIVVDLNKPHLQPIYDVLANIAYSAQSEDICLTMVDGKVLYADGEYKTIDMEKVLFNVNRIKDEKLALLNNPSKRGYVPQR